MDHSKFPIGVLLVFISVIVVLSFQNCSRVEFAAGPQASFSKSSGEDGGLTCRTATRSEVQIAGDATLIPCETGSDTQCALVCHVPEGNPDALHNIIVGVSARNESHQPGAHGGDFDGLCSDTEEEFQACVEN